MSKTAGGHLVTIILTCSYCTCELHAGPVKCRALLLCMHTNANHLYRQSLTHCTMCHVATISMWHPVIPRERHKQGPHATMVTGYIDLYPFSSPYFPHAQMIELGSWAGPTWEQNYFTSKACMSHAQSGLKTLK